MSDLPKTEEPPVSYSSSDRRRKVLYVEANTDGTIGGSHTSLLNLVSRLDKSKYMPVVVFFAHHQLIPEFLAAGAEVHVFSVAPAFSFGSRVQDASSTPLRQVVNLPFRLLRKALNLIFSILIFGILRSIWFQWKEQIDILHLNNAVPVKDEWLIAGRLLGKKCVGHQRGLIPSSPRSRLLGRMRRAAKMLDAAISVSDAVREDLRERGVVFKKNLVIHDALPKEFFRAQKRFDEINTGETDLSSAPTLGIIGNIKRWKGQRVVIEALVPLIPNYPKLRCLIIGEVSSDSLDYLEELHALISRHGLTKNIIFTGYRKNICETMNSLDVIVHASTSPEPFGMVIIEAMSLSKPVIATDAGGPREIIESGVTGILIPPNDPAALARALERLFENWPEALQMGKRAREHVKQHFTVEENVSKTEAVYEMVIGSVE